MAAQVAGIFDEETREAIIKSKLLVVGAGGIGCELLKNLALMGFTDIHLIDLDTIDVSNLNRQFLFRKQHVGKPKAVVAKESAVKLNPNCEITTYHDSITSLKYDVNFYKQFSAVANALDNMAARKHVNRMCIAADIPLVESGSAGYLGQVTVHKKFQCECFECIPKAAPKNFPTCTIRNTPSETIHCVVWAKHLFNQLFGEEDPDQDVSPDPASLPPGGDNNTVVENEDSASKLSTKAQALACGYDAHVLFKKFFNEDIEYLLQMKHLWANRRPPTPLIWEDLPDAVAGSSVQIQPTMKDQELWSLRECANVFKDSLSALKKRVDNAKGDRVLTWDKDDKGCMDFVAACANLRAYCFGIAQECRFKLKSMAGNIIPAIATTNAIVGGLIALQLLNVLKKNFKDCRSAFLNASVTPTRNKLISSCMLQEPNPQCFVCSSKIPEVHVLVNIDTLIMKTIEKILIESLNMVAPDIYLGDGSGKLLMSSDPEEREDDITEKNVANFGIRSGCHLMCDDFFQHFKLTLVLDEKKELVDQDYEFPNDISEVKPTEEEEPPSEKHDIHTVEESAVGEEEDDVVMVQEETYAPLMKRKLEEENGPSSKKFRVENSSVLIQT